MKISPERHFVSLSLYSNEAAMLVFCRKRRALVAYQRFLEDKLSWATDSLSDAKIYSAD